MVISALHVAVALASPATIAIVGGRVEVGDGNALPVATIVIQGDRIQAVGPNIEVPAGAKIIDAKGLTIYPGFIDAYSDKGLKIPAAKAAGEAPDSRNTAPATMWHGNRKGIRAELDAGKLLDLKGELEGWRKQGVTTKLLSPGGGMASGLSVLVDLTAEGTLRGGPIGAELGFRNGSGTSYPGTLFGVTATLRQLLADADRYSRLTPKKEEEDAVLANLVPVTRGEMPAIFNANSAREILRAARIAEEFNLKMVVYGGSEGYRMVDLLKERKAPVILAFNLAEAPTVKASEDPDATPVEVQEERLADWKERSVNPRILADAGIPIAFGGVTGFTDYLTGVRRFVTAGLPRATALRAMTLGPATIFGVERDLGTIAPGKLANLTLMNGDFVDEKAAVTMVVVNGSEFEIAKEAKK
jgi:imidazolonepropionase-like amidohydrolase